MSGVVLTGGASRRMGRDKSHLEVAGLAGATRIARLLDGLVEEVLLVGGDPPRQAPGRRVCDPPGLACALRGLVAGLEAASAERVLVLATDLPLVTPDLLLALTAWPQADAVVPRSKHGPEPLCALYRREPVLAVARLRLERGDLALRGLLDALRASYLEPSDLAEVDPEGRALTNLNTPEDVSRIERWLAG